MRVSELGSSARRHCEAKIKERRPNPYYVSRNGTGRISEWIFAAKWATIPNSIG